MNKRSLTEHLESLSNGKLPGSFYACNERELRELAEFADNVVEFQNAGLDKLFKSMSLTMKYIPNFVIVSLSKRFLEPPVAARITRQLKLKQITSVGNEMPATYLAEVSFYQDVKLSARIFGALRKTHALEILVVLSKRYPLKTLDLYPWLQPEFQRTVRENLSLDQLDKSALHSAERKATFKVLKKAVTA